MNVWNYVSVNKLVVNSSSFHVTSLLVLINVKIYNVINRHNLLIFRYKVFWKGYNHLCLHHEFFVTQDYFETLTKLILSAVYIKILAVLAQ